MKKWMKVCLYIFVGLLVLLGFLLWGLNKLADDLCGNKIVEEVTSPNHKYKIIIFVRDCGATTDFSAQASIVNAEQPLQNEGGNLFIADTDHGKAPSAPDGGPKVKAAWKNNNLVIIKHDKCARVFKAESKVKDISVVYGH